MKTDLSIVIVIYNSAACIAACLDAVARATKTYTTQIFVVDSGSTDAGPQVVASGYPHINLLRQSNIGFSAGNNVALPLCCGDYILLLNPDTVVDQQSLPLLMQALEERPAFGAVGPCLRSKDGSIQEHCAHNLPTLRNMLPWLFLLDKLEWHLRFRRKPVAADRCPQGTLCDGFTLLHWGRTQTAEVPYLSGACLMLRKSVVDQIGYLDAASPLYLDDIDYCRRIQDKGWKLLYLADASVLHYGQQSSASFERDSIFYAMLCHSIWIYLRKHHGRVAALSYRLTALSAGLLRLSISSCLGALSRGLTKAECVRHRQMSSALLLWAAGHQKNRNQLNFQPAPITPAWHGLARELEP